MLTLKPKSKIVAYDNTDKKIESVYSKRIRAGKRRTYFFDVRATRGNDYFLTITESRKRFDSDGYDRHKIFLYKEDFNKFIKALGEAADYVKTELMPDFDFDAFNHEYDDQPSEGGEVFHEAVAVNPEPAPAPEKPSEPSIDEPVPEVVAAVEETPVSTASNLSTEEVDKW